MQNEYDFLQRLYMDNSATKFGYAFYLSYFFRNVLDLRRRFDRITLKKQAKPYTVSDFCMGVCIAVSVGCCPFSRIDTELYEERKLACSIGLEKGFFSSRQAHRILNTFSGYHVNQLKRIAQTLISEFGDAPRDDLIIVDIDQSTRSTYACKREGATTGKTPKHGQNCLQWSVVFCDGEVIDQQLKEGYRHCIDDFKERYQQALKVLSRIDVLRIDGGYLSAENLQYIGEQLFCTKAGINLNCVQQGLQNAEGHYWKRIDKHTKIFDCGLMNIFSKADRKYRLIIVKGQKRQERRIPKTQRIQGKGYRSFRITYKEIIFGILTNIDGKAAQIYEFYKHRQTIENYFRDSNWSFETGKLPSQRFSANQAYLWLISIVQNSLQWFKRQCLPEYWQSCSYQKIRDELISRKALVTVKPGYVQINFSIYFKYKEVHDFAADRLERIKDNIDRGEPFDNYWKFSFHPSVQEELKAKIQDRQ
ncbi:MAG: transposase [Desulfobacteraceae bacterium]|nr:transposase [Lentisphaerota bacterium]MCP4107616.1 transposase [Desulfobacteraceae bacterium]